MRAFQSKLQEWAKRLELLAERYSDKEAVVVETDNHVNVGEGHGLNGTPFAIKTGLSDIEAVVFKGKEDAERNGIDLFLVDMYDKPIEQRITPAHEFYKREAEKIRKLMVFIKEHTKEGK